MSGEAGRLSLYRKTKKAMQMRCQHAKLGLKKKAVAESCRYRKRDTAFAEIIVLSATGSVGCNTPHVIVLIYACTYHGCI